jgi:hypothetical protein
MEEQCPFVAAISSLNARYCSGRGPETTADHGWAGHSIPSADPIRPRSGEMLRLDRKTLLGS